MTGQDGSSTDGGEPERPPRTPEPRGGLPVQIRPAVAAVLVVGAVLAVSTFFFDPPPEVRYGLVGMIAVLYFATKVKHWL